MTTIHKLTRRGFDNQPIHNILVEAASIRSLWSLPVGCEIRMTNGIRHQLSEGAAVVTALPGFNANVMLGARPDSEYDGAICVQEAGISVVLGRAAGSDIVYDDGTVVQVIQSPDNVLAEIIGVLQPVNEDD